MDDQLLYPSRILVVDDQEANALLLQAVLAHAGYTAVETMTDSLAVVQRCSEHRPTCCCWTGTCRAAAVPEILEEIRYLTDEPNWMPVLVLTADIASDTKRRALSLGARDFLTKPIDVAEVLLRVRNLLQTRYLRARAAAPQRPAARARAAAHAGARGRQARDARPPGAGGRVPRRRDRPARRSHRTHERGARARARAR